MAKTWSLRDRIGYPAEKVLELMLDTDFMERWTKVQGGIDPRATLSDAGPDRKQMKLRLTEKAGAIGTFRATLTFLWDLKAFSMDWSREAEGLGSKAKVGGITRIIKDGDSSCFLEENGKVDVNIPLMGKKIEEGVVKHQSKGRPAKIGYLVAELEKG